MLFFFFFALCDEIFSKIFFVRDKEREQNSLSPFFCLCRLMLSTTTTKKIQKREKSSRERENQSFLFPTTTSYISLSSARERWKR